MNGMAASGCVVIRRKVLDSLVNHCSFSRALSALVPRNTFCIQHFHHKFLCVNGTFEAISVNMLFESFG